MPAPECKCRIFATPFEGADVSRCPLHEAAGDMYTVLEEMTRDLGRYRSLVYGPSIRAMIDRAEVALLKANPNRREAA